MLTSVPFEALMAALAAAVLHASWNAAVKGSRDRLLDVTLLSVIAGVMGLGLALTRAPLAAEAWFWVAATSLIHIAYMYLLAKAYDTGELGHVYTVARGLPPMFIALLASIFIQETPTPNVLVGIALITTGILAVGLSPGAHLKGTLIAIGVALTIASYSMTDGIGARASGDPLAYAGWVFFAVGITQGVMGVALRGRRAIVYARTHWKRGIVNAALSGVAYTLVLWAMTIAPIAAISALRETSVVFAALLGIVFFGEKLSKRRVLGALIVAAGAIVLKAG